MNRLVQRARDISGTVASAVRRAVDPPLDDDDTPLAVRRAILESIEQDVQPAGGGRRVLPAGSVLVQVLAADAVTQRALKAVLQDITDAAAARLRELRCDVPREFSVDVRFTRAAPADWEPEQRVAVVLRSLARSAGPVDSALQPPLHITVLHGDTGRPEYTLTEPIVRLGRSESPTGADGHGRRNHVAFLEDGREPNRTVTRGHAYIRFDRVRSEYRLFDEGSANGTRIIRGGQVIVVPRRDPIGVVLVTGDEVELGKAVLRVQVGVPDQISS